MTTIAKIAGVILWRGTILEPLKEHSVSTWMDLQTSFREVIRTYHELNPARIEELHDEPSPLEFFRYVAKNRPLVIRGAAKTRKAYIRWNSEYLKTKLGQSRIQVAVTPDG